MKELPLEKKIEYTKECIKEIEGTKYPNLTKYRGAEVYSIYGICEFIIFIMGTDHSFQEKNPHIKDLIEHQELPNLFPEIFDRLKKTGWKGAYHHRWTNTPQGKAARLRFLRKLLAELEEKI